VSRVAYHNFFDSRVAHKNKNARMSRVAYRNVSEKAYFSKKSKRLAVHKIGAELANSGVTALTVKHTADQLRLRV